MSKTAPESSSSSAREKPSGPFGRFSSISRQLQVYVGAAAALALGLTVWMGYRVTRHELELQTNARAMAEVRSD